MTSADIRLQIRDYIVENFLYMREDADLADTDSLLGNGVLDSMGVMELVAFVEETYAIEVADEEVTEEKLGSIAAVAAFVESKRALAAA